jgi:hypothetical protein
MPELRGRPVEIRFMTSIEGHGPVDAGAFLRERRIFFEKALRSDPRHLARIFVHEIFHFAWLRMSNQMRRSYEEMVDGQMRFRGELGWSSAWRKEALTRADRRRRTRRWREYCCESFCDTAAWLFSGVRRHPEFTLRPRLRLRRRAWFERFGVTKRISI